ncbi:hypothetical protein [Hymenobacter cavernae]|uniref:Uncharacterized protein n=1 Tax=Hymenobacter cavernae TaxID=2044852 RepID=A0ABQ1UZ63_9BACT|nr:hypothetical protein [Hymenobacter cavernae]GGF28850.1 hypothetical protein GCM10011383_45710 [Hymenobacter cavernae]
MPNEALGTREQDELTENTDHSEENAERITGVKNFTINKISTKDLINQVLLVFRPIPGHHGEAVYAQNYSDQDITFSYTRTVHSARPTSHRHTKTVSAGTELGLGNTCAYDVTYTSLCGSRISYTLG